MRICSVPLSVPTVDPPTNLNPKVSKLIDAGALAPANSINEAVSPSDNVNPVLVLFPLLIDNLEYGFEVPMPTFPADVMRIRSEPLFSNIVSDE